MAKETPPAVGPEEIERLSSLLPDVPGIQGRHRYFNSAILVPFVWLQGEYHLLFQVRATNIRQGDEVCFPGGAFEEGVDESYLETALRETEEELGLGRDRIELLGRLDTLVVPMGTALEPYIGMLNVESLEELNPDPSEVARIFTLPAAYFLEHEPEVYSVRVEVHPYRQDEAGREITLLPSRELGLPARYHSSWGGKEIPIFVYRTPEAVIWGMTAEIIGDLMGYLKP